MRFDVFCLQYNEIIIEDKIKNRETPATKGQGKFSNFLKGFSLNIMQQKFSKSNLFKDRKVLVWVFFFIFSFFLKINLYFVYDWLWSQFSSKGADEKELNLVNPPFCFLFLFFNVYFVVSHKFTSISIKDRTKIIPRNSFIWL